MTASRAEGWGPVRIGGQLVEPGDRLTFDLPVALLPTHTQLHIPVCVVHGRRPGPRVWVSAAVHGDELNGVEIISRVIAQVGEEEPLLRGTLVAVPIVNVFGFIGQSRYLPDRRDLNRSFPGSNKGALASRIAHLFMTEIVDGCTHGIDLHTASLDRSNLPQVRGDFSDRRVRDLAEAFGAPVALDSATRSGSLRGAAGRLGIPVIVYEGGAALRFNESAIEVGVRGVQDVLRSLGMLKGRKRKPRPCQFLGKSSWVRARKGGLLRLSAQEGDSVEKGQRIGSVADPLGADRTPIRAPFDGVVVGASLNPIVHAGDALVHVAQR